MSHRAQGTRSIGTPWSTSKSRKEYSGRVLHKAPSPGTGLPGPPCQVPGEGGGTTVHYVTWTDPSGIQSGGKIVFSGIFIHPSGVQIDDSVFIVLHVGCQVIIIKNHARLLAVVENGQKWLLSNFPLVYLGPPQPPTPLFIYYSLHFGCQIMFIKDHARLLAVVENIKMNTF